MILRWRTGLAIAILALLQIACGGGGSGIQVTVTPAQVTLTAGATQSFTASVSNSSNASVTWQVNGIDGGNSSVGTIDANGFYTAPSAPPLPPSVTVTAVSKADTSQSASATVTLTGGTVAFSNASLTGPYVFAFQSSNIAHVGATVPVMAAGRFVSDGNGNITSGSEDLNDGVSAQVQTVALTGTYAVQQDGRGTMKLSLPQGTLDLSFVLRSDGGGNLLITQTSLIGSGQFARQDSAALNPASLAGAYAFQWFGDTSISNTVGPIAESGVLTFDANGNITGGTEDVNNQGTINQNVAAIGSYAFAGVAGRVTFTLRTAGGAAHFAAYIASSNRLLVIETDGLSPATTGEMDRQAGGGFSNASLSGPIPFSWLGTNALHLIAQAGVWQTDGNGTLTGGLFDQNDTGAITSAGTITGGTYHVGADGRIALTVHSDAGTTLLAGVLISAQHGFLTGVDTSLSSHGEFFTQPAPSSGSSFTVADLNEALAGTLTGVTGQGPQAVLLQLKADGAGGIGGTADLQQVPGVTLNQAAGGTYTLDGSGRGLLTLTLPGSTRHFAFYLAGSGIVLVNQDSPELLTGILVRQF